MNNKQVALEKEMREEGINRFHKSNNEKASNGQESTSSYGQYLLKNTITILSSNVEEFITSSLTGRAGRSSTSAILLQNLEAEVVSLITLRVALNQITSKRDYSSSAVVLGLAIEDELRIRTFEENNPKLYRVVKKDLDSRSSGYTYKRRKLFESAKRDGITWSSWTQREKLLVGNALLDLTIQHTGLLELKSMMKNGKRRQLLLASETTLKIIKDLEAFQEVLRPEYYPCVVPPREWTNPTDGGYHTHHVKQLAIVKTDNKNYLQELKHFDMPMVYGAVNAMQNTAFKVNTFILETLTKIWDNGMELPTLPPSENYTLPNKPFDIATNHVAKTNWKRQAVIIHTENNRMASKRLLLRKTIQVADKFKDEPEIYMVYQLDFRGRIYAVPNYLNPQGTDFAKALLTFSHGKKLNEQGACHLAIHGANQFGYDKHALQDRIDWTLENQDRILSCAKDPINDLWWAKEADKPFEFLAFCKEWESYLNDPENFESCLPVSADGSCNGLQHFAAMLRSETTGKEVNLIPMEEPQDIYQKVADSVIKKLQAITDPDQIKFASLWLGYGVTRKCCKRPCMVLPYGGKQYSFTDFVVEYVTELTDKGVKNTFGDDLFKASSFLSKLIWNSISEVVHAATDAMSWLQKAARVASSEGLPIRWDTPCNFPVLQAYQEVKSNQIETKLMGKVFKPRVYSQTGKLDKNRQANGISPNFVHSIDASHLMITLHVAKQLDIHSFAMVHDSYGTHAQDAEEMWSALRTAFVEMYSQMDVLEEFRNYLLEVLPKHRHKEIEPIPTKGKLDINNVLKSSFFFA
tara:strand:- start:3669 stop:6086 length:2418 start_codon:yes stop_codon:yes gene_type:complete